MNLPHFIEGLNPQHLIANVLHKFHEHRSHYLPVMEAGSLKGVLRLKDVQTNPSKIQVSDLMISPAKTIESNCSLEDAISLMVNQNITALVVTENQKVIGLLCADDLLKFFSLFLKDPTHSVKEHFDFLLAPNALGLLANILNKIDTESTGLGAKSS